MRSTVTLYQIDDDSCPQVTDTKCFPLGRNLWRKMLSGLHPSPLRVEDFQENIAKERRVLNVTDF